ncbi:ArnT family glycosyltransferase [Polaromonas sp. CT11-55]|uniref:ArnT family glycosyltransferase n=1 Tax=Polaromonas sp. CT11-55 TaxID=3243045 RepID=UPI0039A73378
MNTKSNHKTILVLLVLWLFATYWNIDKPFHIDDAGHLAIAQWIEKNPLHPMSGLVNWNGNFEPISQLNQPHLYFYLMAGWAHFFGYSEIAIHCLMSLFTLWAIVAFYRLAKLVEPDYALHVTALFSLSSVFVVGQNSMVDVPLIAVWMEFYYTLMNPRYGEKRKYAIASVLCAAALLIKYTSLVLIPAMLLQVVLTKKYRNTGWILIPVATLVLWSAFNVYDYGGVHLLDRPNRVSQTLVSYLTFSMAWVMAIGAILPCVFLGFYAKFKESPRIFPKVVFGFLCAATLLVPAVVLLSSVADVALINLVLFASFLLSGIGVLCICYQIAKAQAFGNGMTSIQYLLLYWIGASFIFIVFFAPFVATRHVLLAMPAVLLLIYPQVVRASNIAKLYWISVALTIFNTTLLAKADSWYAGIYKTNAVAIAQYLPADTPIWFVGHWGWQWYAQQAGMRQLALNSPRPNIGDYLVVPFNVIGSEHIPAYLEGTELKTVEVMKEHWFQHYASSNFYVSHDLPWHYSNGPMEVFKLYRITGIKN